MNFNFKLNQNYQYFGRNLLNNITKINYFNNTLKKNEYFNKNYYFNNSMLGKKRKNNSFKNSENFQNPKNKINIIDHQKEKQSINTNDDLYLNLFKFYYYQKYDSLSCIYNKNNKYSNNEFIPCFTLNNIHN